MITFYKNNLDKIVFESYKIVWSIWFKIIKGNMNTAKIISNTILTKNQSFKIFVCMKRKLNLYIM